MVGLSPPSHGSPEQSGGRLEKNISTSQASSLRVLDEMAVNAGGHDSQGARQVRMLGQWARAHEKDDMALQPLCEAIPELCCRRFHVQGRGGDFVGRRHRKPPWHSSRMRCEA